LFVVVIITICIIYYTFHAGCLRESLNNNINTANVILTCVYDPKCKAEYLESMIKKALGVGKKYKKWEKIKAVEDLRNIKKFGFFCLFVG
jgi:hypothetical protein